VNFPKKTASVASRKMRTPLRSLQISAADGVAMLLAWLRRRWR